MSSKKQENPFVSIVLNVVLPSVILVKFSGQEHLGPVKGLIVALMFPLIYGIYDFVRVKKVNFISLLGLISVLLTGVFGLLQLPPLWIAVKEAAVPFAIGTVVFFTAGTRHNLVKKIFWNDSILSIEDIEKQLIAHNNSGELEEKFKIAAYIVTLSFILSSILNFVLARVLLVSEPGSEAFNQELGRMTALSFPVIALPSMIVFVAALWYLVQSIQKLTKLKIEEIFISESKPREGK